MHSKPIRDDAGNRLFDAVYNPDGSIAIELKIARQKLIVTLDAVREQIEAGQREAKQIAASRPANAKNKKR